MVRKSDQALIEVIIEKYIQSQGGHERLATLRTLEVEGIMSLESQGLEIPIVQKIESPDKMLLTQEYESFGVIREVLNRNSGWEWHPVAGERPLDEEEVEELLKDADLQRDLKLFEVYETIRLGEPEIIEGNDTTHLIFLDSDGKEEHWYFLENGDLFQKIHTVVSGPESEFESKERFYDYENLSGISLCDPNPIPQIPAYTAELRVTLCLINEEFDHSSFELPPAAQIEAGVRRF